MVKAAKTGSITLRHLIFWSCCFALFTSFGIFVLEKTRVTNIYEKPIAIVNDTMLNIPTNIIDYPISNNSDNSPEDKSSGTEKPIASDVLSGNINFKTVTAEKLSIRATIFQNINSGTCTLLLTHTSDKRQVTKTAKVIENPSSATCAGFDIPLIELDTGEWDIQITVESGGKTGKITGEVSI